jgi:hypothetical protein
MSGYAAGLVLALEHNDIGHPALAKRDCRGEPRGSAANDHDV